MPHRSMADELPIELRVAEALGRAVSPEEQASYLEAYPRTDAAAAQTQMDALPDEDKAALEEPFEVTAAMVAFYQENGFIHLRGVLPPALVEVLGGKSTSNLPR